MSIMLNDELRQLETETFEIEEIEENGDMMLTLCSCSTSCSSCCSCSTSSCSSCSTSTSSCG